MPIGGVLSPHSRLYSVPTRERGRHCCELAASQGHSLAGCAEPAFAGVVTSVPSPMRARRPRSRVGLARILIAANWLRARATPWQGGPNLPLQGSSPLCQVLCGRDARAPGWVSPASLLLRTGCDPGPLLGKVGRTYPCRVRHLCAKSYAGETPALPGGSRPHPYCCELAASQGHSLARWAEPTLAGFVTCAKSYAGGTPALPGGSRPHPYWCELAAIQGHSLAGCAEAFAGSSPLCQVLCGRDARAPGWVSPGCELAARATPWQGGPNLPLQGSSPLCQVLCGRDARAPGWVSPASLLLRTGCEPGPLLGRVRRTFAGFGVLCGRDARAPGWVSPASLLLRTGCQGGRTCPWVVTSVPSPMRAGRPRSRVGSVAPLLQCPSPPEVSAKMEASPRR